MDREKSKASTTDPHPDPLLRGALRELADAARWASDQSDPALAITGYSWFNVALEQVDALVPNRTSVEQQVRVSLQAVGGVWEVEA